MESIKWFYVETRTQVFNNPNLNACFLTETKIPPKVVKLIIPKHYVFIEHL